MLKFNAKLLPNYLTILRLILVPFIFALIITENYIGAIVLFVIASITDILDGRIARKYNLITDWGRLADPLADKLTQISTISALTMKHIIPFWILAVITAKEIVMIISTFVIYKKETLTIKSKWYGKTATVILFVAIIFSLLSKTFAELSKITIYIYYVAIFVTLFAGLMYGRNFIIQMIKKERNRQKVTA